MIRMRASKLPSSSGPTVAALTEAFEKLEPAGVGWPIELSVQLRSTPSERELEQAVIELAERTGLDVSVHKPSDLYGGVAWNDRTLRNHDSAWNQQSTRPAARMFLAADPPQLVTVAQHRFSDARGLLVLVAAIVAGISSPGGPTESILASITPVSLRNLEFPHAVVARKLLTHPQVWTNLWSSRSGWVIESRGPLDIPGPHRRVTARSLVGIARHMRWEFPGLRTTNVMVTVDLRSDPRRGVANHSLAANLPISLKTAPGIEEIDGQLHAVRNGDLVGAYWSTLKRAVELSKRSITRPIPRLAAPWLGASVILSNLGDVSDFEGDWVAAKIVIPVRNARVPSVGLVTVDGRTYLTVTMGDGGHRRDRARGLADSIAQSLEE